MRLRSCHKTPRQPVYDFMILEAVLEHKSPSEISDRLTRCRPCWCPLTVMLVPLLAVWILGADVADADSKAASPTPARAAAESDADRAWRELAALRPPAEPPDWAFRQPLDEERRMHQQTQVEFACRASDSARDFYIRFPDHDMAPVAMSLERKFLEPFKADVLEFRTRRIEQEAQGKAAEGEAAVLAEMERRVREMLQEFPDHFVPNQMLLRIARQLDVGKARELAEEVHGTRGLSEFVKQEAAELLKKLNRVGKPLALTFTASDGRKVDLETLKGKVVLIDFWSTWCAPCVGELPRMKTTHDKLHAQGFEILGISFDQDKDTLTRFLQKEQIPWPQFFDGKGWRNQFAQEFGINSIPTMWLVDKRGNLRDINARSATDEKVRKLLAEAP